MEPFMSLDTPTVNQLTLVISQAAAPAFLLGAVASYLSVLISHMSRIIDRSRAIKAILEKDANRTTLNAVLLQLKMRASLINRAVYWAVGSGISTCCLMIVAFASAYMGVRHEPGAAILFTVSLGLFTGSLVCFAFEVRIALNDVEFS
jgi:hypothetical protein